MARREGGAPKKFTIPSIEEIRQYGVNQEDNGPVLFNKSVPTSFGGRRQDKPDEHVVELQSAISSEAMITNSVAITTVTSSSTTSPLTDSTTVTMTTGSSYSIVANPVQKNNPVVHFIRNIPVMFDDVIPDFVLGRTTCALFLSVRYHKLHPNYIHDRLKQLGRQYTLRILLLLVDVVECQKTLQELTKISLLADCTLILSWSVEEAARYLETYKAYENKPPDVLKERVESDTSVARAIECLTSVKKINKSNASMLVDAFKLLTDDGECSTCKLTSYINCSMNHLYCRTNTNVILEK
ncbi:DNA excision repair protein ERCC-1-like isoform X2 [Dysidea avara]|uniref:DNA excision repair protein ERCC-1-like isoform X2 n=2 Tax=Dysidea avara TaxID=196820 RepID=UPI00333314BD